MRKLAYKPTYTLTRQAFWLSFCIAWGLILWVTWAALAGSGEAVALANIIVPSMVMMVAALLGIHRAFGAMDMRTLAASQAAEAAAQAGPSADEESAR
jgi:ABC-type glucose/galactose transport system permease subunit